MPIAKRRCLTIEPKNVSLSPSQPEDLEYHKHPSTTFRSSTFEHAFQVHQAIKLARGGAFDNPDLIVACVIGDGEAETGALAASWHSNKFLNPAHDAAVLPILHLNGYKIANPTVLGRMSDEEVRHLFIGYGYEPFSSRAMNLMPCMAHRRDA